MIFYKDMAKRLPKGIFKHSAIDEHDTLQNALSRIGNSNCTVEIGTYYGLSTIVLGSWSKKIMTFDIVYHPEFGTVKRVFPGLQNIHHHVIKDREDIAMDIHGLVFDFAFIDAVHDEENVRKDFEIVKSCGRVLFHDANVPGIKKFLTEIKATIFGPNDVWGYWTEDYNLTINL